MEVELPPMELQPIFSSSMLLQKSKGRMTLLPLSGSQYPNMFFEVIERDGKRFNRFTEIDWKE
jgi:hypothetical protein